MVRERRLRYSTYPCSRNTRAIWQPCQVLPQSRTAAATSSRSSLTRSSIVIGPCELVVLSAFSATKFARQGKSLRGDLVRGAAQTNPPVEQAASNKPRTVCEARTHESRVRMHFAFQEWSCQQLGVRVACQPRASSFVRTLTLPVAPSVRFSLSSEFCSRSEGSSAFAAGQVKRQVTPDGA